MTGLPGGIIPVYKEKGYTSNDVVVRLRGILHVRKAGHTGTLDPEAEGVLPVCIGNGTGICALIADDDKEYRAVMRLGIRTDTQDMTGSVVEQIPEDEVRSRISEEKLRESAAAFTGEYEQTPPMYSALKVHGKKLYELAREGKTVERKARRIHIYALEILEVRLPVVTIRVHCSKGTYIRTLCEDIGRKMNVPACMESLLRTRVGRFTLDQAIRLDEIEEKMHSGEPEKAMKSVLIPVDAYFENAPAVTVSENALRFLKNGNRIREDQVSGDYDPGEKRIRMYDEKGVFYAVYCHDEQKKMLIPVKMFLPG